MLRSTDICPESCWLVRSLVKFGGGSLDVALSRPCVAFTGFAVSWLLCFFWNGGALDGTSLPNGREKEVPQSAED